MQVVNSTSRPAGYGYPSTVRDSEAQAVTIGQSLFGRSAVFVAGNLAYKAISLFAVPILARLLAPAELGLLDLSVVFAGGVGLLAGAGLENAVARLRASDAPEPRVWGSALTVLVGAIILVVAVSLVFGAELSTLLTGTSAHQQLFRAAAVYGSGMAVGTAGLNAVRLRGTAWQYAISAFVLVTAEMGAALGLAARASDPVLPIVYAWSGIGFVGGILLLVWQLDGVHTPNRGTVAGLLRFGLPLVPAALAWVIGDLAIRSTLGQSASLGSLGAYGIAVRIVSVLSLAVAGFGLAWHPHLYAAPAASTMSLARVALLRLAVTLSTLGALLAAASPEIVRLLGGPAYLSATSAVGPLAAGSVFLGVQVVASAAYGTEHRTTPIAVASVLGAITQVVVAPVIVPALSVAGAAIASMAGYAVAASWLVIGMPGLLAASSRSGRRWAALLASGIGLLIFSVLDLGSQPIVRFLIALSLVVLALATLLSARATESVDLGSDGAE